MSEKSVAVDIEGAGLFLTDRTAECVYRRSNLNVDKAAVLEHLLPARTGQPTSNSTGPQIDVAKRLKRNRETVGDVGELQRAAGSENTMDLCKHGSLVGT